MLIHKLSTVFVSVFAILFLLVPLVFAAGSYGEGGYSSGLFNVGQPAEESSSSSSSGGGGGGSGSACPPGTALIDRKCQIVGKEAPSGFPTDDVTAAVVQENAVGEQMSQAEVQQPN